MTLFESNNIDKSTKTNESIKSNNTNNNVKSITKYGFWNFCNDNPTTLIIILVIFLGLVAILMGYREGFASVLTGLFGYMKKDDSERKLEMKQLEINKMEAERDADYRSQQLKSMSGNNTYYEKYVGENHDDTVSDESYITHDDINGTDTILAKSYADETDMSDLDNYK